MKKSKYNWKEIQKYYDEGHSYEDIKSKYGLAINSIIKARDRGDFISRSKTTTIFDYSELVEMYNEGYSFNEIRTQLNIFNHRIKKAIKMGLIIPRSKSDAQKLARMRGKGIKAHSVATKEKISAVMQNKMSNRYTRSKRIMYKGILLESSWEYELALNLDDNFVNWNRPSPLKYLDDNGQTRRYYPDFYLPDYNVYLDPKNNYVTLLDQQKIKKVMDNNKVRIIILKKDQLNWDYIKSIL